MRGSAIVLAAWVVGMASWAVAAVEVSTFRVEERRSVTLLKDTIGRIPDGLEVTLSLKGPEAEAAEQFGNVKIEEAVDDQGTDLTPSKSVLASMSKLREYSNAFFRNSSLRSKRPAADPQIALKLGVPKRGATKVARLRGTFDLVQKGSTKTVELTPLLAGEKKKLEIPAEAGIEVTVTVKGGEGTSSSVELQVTGDDSALESVEVVDGAGKKVSRGMSSWSMEGGPVTKSVDLERPIDGTMKLVVKMAMDRKRVTVPFDLKDIPLP